MAEHSNGNIVRRFFAAHAADDLETLVEILAEDVVWHLPRGGTRLSLNPTVMGLGALAEVSARNAEASDGTFRFEVDRVFAGDSYAAAITHNTATTADRALDLHMVIQFQIEDGKIVEVWESPDDIDAFTNFWQANGV
ncbi:MAG TPA: nuclear transport factor 2 family protein [Acidimicrobiales bacterium]